MLRTAVATALLGLAAALVAASLHLTTASWGALAGRYWPIVLVTSGAVGLYRGLGPGSGGRWLPLAIFVCGLALLAGSLLHLPVPALFVAAILVYAGLSVAGVRPRHSLDPDELIARQMRDIRNRRKGP